MTYIKGERFRDSIFLKKFALWQYSFLKKNEEKKISNLHCVMAILLLNDHMN